MRLQIVPDAGHSAKEEGIQRLLTEVSTQDGSTCLQQVHESEVIGSMAFDSSAGAMVVPRTE
jgi:hypothetical protein